MKLNLSTIFGGNVTKLLSKRSKVALCITAVAKLGSVVGVKGMYSGKSYRDGDI